MNMVLENLWIGDLGDASQNYLAPGGGKFLVDVRWPDEYLKEPYPSLARLAVPTTICSDTGLITTDVERMHLVASILNSLLPSCPTMVHCSLGMERSPLTVVWYLMEYKGMRLDKAYELVMEKHPQTLYRGEWLPLSVRLDGHL